VRLAVGDDVDEVSGEGEELFRGFRFEDLDGLFGVIGQGGHDEAFTEPNVLGFLFEGLAVEGEGLAWFAHDVEGGGELGGGVC
jgi:hypothetical protein